MIDPMDIKSDDCLKHPLYRLSSIVVRDLNRHWCQVSRWPNDSYTTHEDFTPAFLLVKASDGFAHLSSGTVILVVIRA